MDSLLELAWAFDERASVMEARSIQELKPLSRFVKLTWTLMPGFRGADDFNNVRDIRKLLF